MKTNKTHTAGLIAGAVALSLVASSAQAQLGQLGQLRGLVPGVGGGNAASYSPDAFLAETAQTTQMMMIAAVALRAASDERENREQYRARITQLNGSTNVGELNAHKAAFQEDLQALSANAAEAEVWQTRFDGASSDQRSLMLNAAFNFSLAMVRNVRLAQQAPTLVNNIARNPMMLTKLGQLRAAAELIMIQTNAARSMWTPMRAIMAKGGVAEPQDSSSTQPRAVEI
ncbi:MAG TPA: hypothetical protein PLQ03_04680 [Brevundimonas sp.]|uniref:hypothetical protein n=1 Tax=Brevundimonas sp. TaxID=1871086 RepID=UPI002626F8AE|nr:hypothetical protein [Brevundimonas sp.]HRO32690.1 hypothetical protein [Brevundimonas sp.]